MYKSHRYNTGGFLFSLTYKHKKKSDKPVQLFRASCRIRTNDPEITNHVLWPTELKRQSIYFFEPLVGFEPTTPRLQITCSGQLVSLPYRAATTNYLCCDQALEDSKGAGRMGLTRIQHVIEYPCRGCFSIAGAKVDIFSEFTIPSRKKMKKIGKIRVFSAFYTLRLTEKDYFCSHY